MAYFKKRRTGKIISKNEEKAIRASRAESQLRMAGVLGSRFPLVKRLTMKLAFLDIRKNILEEKTWALGPMDSAVFKTSCPGRCGKGTFDFTAFINATVEATQGEASNSFVCGEMMSAGAADTCGCEARFKLELEYLPAVPAKAS